MRQAVEKDFRRGSFLKELLPPRVKKLESQTELVHSSSTRGRRQGNTMVRSTDRGASAGPEETPQFPHCH